MKKLLLTALAALGCAMSVMAAGWQRPKVSKFLPIADQSVGYLYNVSTGMFLVNGNDYNTTASLGMEGLEVKFEDCSAENDGENAWKIRFTVNDGLLFIGHANGCYYDGELKSSNMGHNLWALTDGKDGATRISVSNVDDAFALNKNSEEVEEMGMFYFGWCGEILADGSIDKTKCVYNVNEMECAGLNIGIDWQLVSGDEYAVFAARVELYDVLVESEKAGVSTAEAEAIYNNESATLEQIKAATQKQSEILNNAALMGATDENPVDATFLIKDADCKSDKGWDCTTSYKLQGASYSNGEVTIAGFIERWVNAGSGDNTLSASTMSQTLRSLPEGRYRLEADAIACNQGNNEPVTGITVFASFDGETLSRDVSTGNGKPEHYAIDFVFDKVTDLTIGFDAAEGNTANWIAVDNFRLTYYGVSDNPYLFPLVEIIAELEKLEADGATYWYSVATQSKWEAMLERANEAKDGTPEEMQDMVAEVGEFIKALKAEIEAYASVIAFMAMVEQAQSDFAEFPTVVEGMGDFYMELSDNYDDGVYSVEDIAALGEKYDEIIGNGIRADIQPGTDLTMLIKNPDFTGNDNSGWSGTRPSTEHEVAEVFNSEFDMYQTLTHMPAGQYTVRVNGFFRLGDAAAYMTHYNEGTNEVRAVLYANNDEQPLCDIKEGMRTDANYTSGWAGKLADDTEVYIPNMRISFAEAQSMGFYKNELTTCVGDDGLLRIGIRTTGEIEKGSWTCFDSFTLTYDGASSTGIAAAENATMVKTVEYYSANGIRLARPEKGVNIVRAVMSDGSIKTSKVLVK